MLIPRVGGAAQGIERQVSPAVFAGAEPSRVSERFSLVGCLVTIRECDDVLVSQFLMRRFPAHSASFFDVWTRYLVERR